MTTKKTTNKGFDLSDLKPTSETIKVDLKHPITQGPFIKPDGGQMSVTVHAPYSAEYKKAMHEVANERIERASKGKGSDKITAEEVEDNSISFLTKVTKEFDLVLDGKPVEFTKTFVKQLYTEFVGIREQVEAALEDTANFMKR